MISFLKLRQCLLLMWKFLQNTMGNGYANNSDNRMKESSEMHMLLKMNKQYLWTERKSLIIWRQMKVQIPSLDWKKNKNTLQMRWISTRCLDSSRTWEIEVWPSRVWTTVGTRNFFSLFLSSALVEMWSLECYLVTVCVPLYSNTLLTN